MKEESNNPICAIHNRELRYTGSHNEHYFYKCDLCHEYVPIKHTLCPYCCYPEYIGSLSSVIKPFCSNFKCVGYSVSSSLKTVVINYNNYELFKFNRKGQTLIPTIKTVELWDCISRFIRITLVKSIFDGTRFTVPNKYIYMNYHDFKSLINK